MRIFCYGDSDTYGYDPRSRLGGRYPASVRWTDRLSAATGWTVVNAGLNGREIPHTAGQLRDAEALFASSLPFDLTTVFLGGNDLLQGRSAQEAAERMDRFLDRLAAYPAVLLVPPPAVRGAWVSEHLRAESAKLPALYEALAAQRGVPFVNPGAWDIEMTFDGIHYSEAGHGVFALRMQEALTAIARERGLL